MADKFCENIKKIRQEKGYTDAEIAVKLEIPESVYVSYEMGVSLPDIRMLVKICQVLETSSDLLLGISIGDHHAVDFIDKVCEDIPSYGKKQKKKRALAIGVQEFRKIRENNACYIDKTMMIAEFLESLAEVTLITRPRRFGKTLNMSMLAEFLDCSKVSNDIFAGTKIMDTEFVQEMNVHPVVFLSFLTVRGKDAKQLTEALFAVLAEEYQRHQTVWRDEKIIPDLRNQMEETYAKLKDYEISREKDSLFVTRAIQLLCKGLENYYGKKVYVFIDEYDTPFIEAYVSGYYGEVHHVLRGLLMMALKGNPYLNRAMLTGIQRVAKENIFSGLNNLIVCTVKDPEYAEYFGFTEKETKMLLREYDLELTPEVKAMYDGYLFGQKEVYNPWSLTFYAFRKRLEFYWVNTSENKMIRDAMSQCDDRFHISYEKLIEEGSVLTKVKAESSFYEKKSTEALWGFLLNAGIVTVCEALGEDYYRLRIPNQEVKSIFQELTAHHLRIDAGEMEVMFFDLQQGKMDEFESTYAKLLLELPSYHDLKDENSYHMLMLGMCAFLSNDYDIQSNRESGKGRSDIVLKTKKEKLPNMIFEFKYTKDTNIDLTTLAKEAIQQVKKKKYQAGMTGRIRYIGLAHRGKDVRAEWEEA